MHYASSGVSPVKVPAQAAVVLVLAILACNVGTTSPQESSSSATMPEGEPASSSTGPPRPLQAPNPLQVAVKLDQGEATESVIPLSGGAITAESGGVRFTLTIPENALLSDQPVVMTPVSSIDGLPLSGGLWAAVDLKPEGLLLFAPATLTIELPDEVSPSEFLGFSFRHEGEEFFLYPSQVTGNTVSIQLMHFSGYGGGTGSSQDASGMDKFPPSSGEDQAMNAAAAAAARSGGKVPTDEFEKILRDWYKSTVRPNLSAATSDDSAIEKPITEFLRWATHVQLSGLNDEFEGELEQGKRMVSEAINNAIEKASKRCSSQQNPIEARRLIRLAAMAQALGEWGGPVNTSGFAPVAEHAERALTEAARCGKFELKFDSTIETISGCPSNFVSHVRATVTLSVNEGIQVVGRNTYKGEGTLEYVEFSPPSGCPEQQGVIMCPVQSTGKENSTFKVEGATLYNLNYSEDADSQPPTIVLYYDPGNPKETMIVQCPDAEPAEAFQLMQDIGLGEVRMWSDGYRAIHKDDMFGELYVAQDWDYSGGSLYARKVYQGQRGDTENGFSVIENTTMDLFHKPG